MKIEKTGIFLVLTLVWAGCSATGQSKLSSPKIDFGTIKQSTLFEQHVFSNSQLGVAFKVPDCFELVPETQTRSFETGSAQVIFSALCKLEDGSRAAVSYIVEPIPPEVTPEKYAKVNIEKAFPNPNGTLKKSQYKKVFAGKDFQSYDVLINGAEVQLKQQYLMTTFENAGLTLILMASSDSLMSTLVDSVQRSYKPPHKP